RLNERIVEDLDRCRTHDQFQNLNTFLVIKLDPQIFVAVFARQGIVPILFDDLTIDDLLLAARRDVDEVDVAFGITPELYSYLVACLEFVGLADLHPFSMSILQDLNLKPIGLLRHILAAEQERTRAYLVLSRKCAAHQNGGCEENQKSSFLFAKL